MSQDTITRNGATAKADSQVAHATPALDGNRPQGIEGNYKDAITQARDALRELRAQERAARIASRMAKKANRNARESDRVQAQKDRLWKALHAMSRETFGTFANQAVIAWRENKTPEEFSLDAIKERADARALGR